MISFLLFARDEESEKYWCIPNYVIIAMFNIKKVSRDISTLGSVSIICNFLRKNIA